MKRTGIMRKFQTPFIASGGQSLDMRLFSWFIYSMILEILFLYTPVIKDDKKCFKTDKALRNIAILERSVFDFSYLVATLSRIRIGSYQNLQKSTVVFFLIDISIIFPLPQVLVILASKQRISRTKFFFGMYFFLGQHLLKVFRLFKIYKKLKKSGLSLTGWAKLAFNLSYFQVANSIGGIWYFFAVERKITCWKKACISPSGCDQLSFYCNNSSGNYKFSNNSCSTKTENISTYDFGLFHDAIHFDVVGQNKFFPRFLASFRWSLQNISCFGQGLPFSTNVLENLFVIFITISSVVLFFFLIAKVQFEMSKSEERRQQVNEIARFQPFLKLPTNLQKRVKMYQASQWKETRGVDIRQFVNNLPDGLRKEIKRKLCLDLLKKVKGLGEWNDVLLKDLCDLAKPVHFTELSYIVREGNPIDQILFVLQGELWSYSSRIVNPRNGKENYLEDGGCCGEELVAWAQADPDSSNLPVSTKTIQALTTVEGFVLTANDLNKGIKGIKFKKNRAARRIQAFLRSTRNARTSTTRDTVLVI